MRGHREGWIVFGIENKARRIVGTSFRSDRANLDKLKTDIAQKTTDGTSFIEIYDLVLSEGRVVMFQIPAAPRGMPISWDGHYYARESDAQQPLNIEKIERIRRQVADVDWSIGICEQATIDDLDPRAVQLARINFANKYPHLTEEITFWDNNTFLNKAKLIVQGKITRTTILLLGRPEASHFINPAIAQITWIFRNRDKIDLGYEHFSCPLLLAVDSVFAKIRNLRYQYLPDSTIIPDEVDQYESSTIREALNNAIVHQDYTKNSRIQVVEREDGYLIFTNRGAFLPGSVERVIQEDAPFEMYRNTFLAQAMVNLKMIDTIGSGIKRMFINQRKKYFPMPDYDLANDRVQVTLTGKILDMDYARILAQNPDLTLLEIMMLDKVQKGQSLTSDAVKHLRKKGFIEGHRSHLRISKRIASSTGQEVEYSLAKGFDDAFLKQMIVDHVRSFGQASRSDLERLLIAKMPDSFSYEQRQNKVKNLLQDLRQTSVIQATEDRLWRLGASSKV